MKLMIIGSKGQLGTDLVQQASKRGDSVAAADLPECDVTNIQCLDRFFEKTGPVEAVINTAAVTDVDGAEKEQAKAFAVNRDGAANLAIICKQRHLPLIHVSTDYVFDGSILRPYLPSDPVRPICVYARSKAEGEMSIRKTLEHHVIVRTSWLFGLHGPNFVKTMLRLGAEQEALRIVDDQIGCPTYSSDLAGGLLRVASRIEEGQACWGTYHFCNHGAMTWYAFARDIFALAHTHDQSLRVKKVIPILTSHYPRPAQRPHYSVLDCQSFDQTFRFERRAYDDALKEMLGELYRVHA